MKPRPHGASWACALGIALGCLAASSRPSLVRADAPSVAPGSAAVPAVVENVESAASAPQPPMRLPDLAVLVQRGWGWDLTLRGGYAVAGCCIDTRFAGGGRAGVAYWAEPMVYVLGATFDAGAIAGAAVGAEAAILDVAGGLWASLGVGYAWEGRAPLVSASVGWALFGLQYQYRAEPGAPQQHAFTLGVSVPLGVLVSRVLWQGRFRPQAPSAEVPVDAR